MSVASAPVPGLVPPSRHLVLVGLPTVGKSTVGALVAERLGIPFRDADDEIAAAAGCSVSDIFASEGEAGFRRAEERTIASMLGGPPSVIGVGGGAVLSPVTRARLAGHDVVWLSADPQALHDRLAAPVVATRPMLAGSPRQRLAMLAAQRDELYAQVAHHVVAVDGLGPDEVAAQVLAAVTAPVPDVSACEAP